MLLRAVPDLADQMRRLLSAAGSQAAVAVTRQDAGQVRGAPLQADANWMILTVPASRSLQDIPMSVIASWPPPNYVDPVRRSWMPAYAITWQIATAFLVGARYWLRITKRAGSLGMDDAFLLPAFVFGIMFTALACVSTIHFGADRHTWDTPLDEFEYLALSAWLSEIAFLLTTSCTKISVLLFYRRLTDGTYSKRWKWAIYFALVFTGVYCIGFIFALCFNCRPVEAYWTSFSPSYTEEYTCTNTKALNPLSGAFSVISDFYAVVLPMGMMRHFEMDRRKKIALNCVFSLGLIVVGVGIARSYYFTQLGLAYDVTWVAFDVLVWGQLEVQIAMMCACAPVLRVLVRRYLKDPMHRALNTINRSGARSRADNDSRLSNGAGTVPYSSHRHDRDDSQDLEGNGDKKLIRHSMKPSLETVEESVPSTAPSEANDGQGKMVVSVEAYALSELDRMDRPLPPLPYEDQKRNQASISIREAEMKASLSEPFSATEWYSPSSELQERPQKIQEMP